MKQYIAIVASEAGKVTKFQDFATQVEGDAHVDSFGGFVAATPNAGSMKFWVVDAAAKTITHDAAAEAAANAAAETERLRSVSFDAFEDRFTAQEWDDVTGYVYAVDTATGKPKRKALVQGLARAQARNSVDLLDPKTDAFLTLLVAGNVITTAKKTKILEP